MPERGREGGLDAPTRHPLNQDDPDFWNEDSLNKELERVYDICHTCRRCVSLCNAFPTLFDLIDESETMEVDGVDTADYSKVVDQCYLCDLCYLSKCPYVPPHEWNVDFPHLMVRAKAIKFNKGDTKLRDNIITSTDMVGKIASKPLLNSIANWGIESGVARKLLDKSFGIHEKAKLPPYQRTPLRKQSSAVSFFDPQRDSENSSLPINDFTDTVTLFTTCYCNYNEPNIIESLIAVLQHNNIEVKLAAKEHCCGMPKLELGDLGAVKKLKEKNIPILFDQVKKGRSLVSPIPSCVLMFKQELPLMFPEDDQVQTVANAFFDPFEYLHKLFKQSKLNIDFQNSLGNVSYHVACHQRVQNIGPKTKQILELIEDTVVSNIERCSGHDGTYGVKTETLTYANKIAAPIIRQINKQNPDYYGSDCPIAGKHLENNMSTDQKTTHPIDLLRFAYGI